MLNLPRVTGWGTDVMAGAAIRKSTEERANEEDRTRMVAQALLNQAQQGNFTEAGYGALETFGGKALADTYKQTAEQAKDDKRRQLEKMRFEKELIALKKTNEEVDLIDKFSEMGDTDSVKFLVDKANATYKALGLNVNLSPIMDAATRKTKTQEAVSAKLNEKIGAAEKNPTEDTIIAARDFLTNLGKGVKKEFIPIYEKRIAAAESRMQKERDRKQKIQDEIEKEKRTQTVDMTNPTTGRTVKVPVTQQSVMEKQGWEIGGRSEQKPETVINVGNIEAKKKAEDMAYMKSSKFRADIIKDVRSVNKDEWDLADTQNAKDELVKAEADVRIKNMYPSATYGKGKEGRGWYIKNDNGTYELVVPWN